MKLSSIIYKIIELLESVYPDADMHLFNMTENFNRPSFLIFPIINETKPDTYFLNSKTLSIEIIAFMPIEDNNEVVYFEKLNLIDNIHSILDSMNMNVEDRNLKYDFEIKEIDGETSIIIDFVFKDDRKLIIENYETIKNVFINKEG